MKICWDTLNKLKYDKNFNFFKDIYNNTYYFKESCKKCGESFLGVRTSLYCCKSCSLKGKAKSKESKEKMSLSGKNKHFSLSHRRNISKSLKGNKNGFYGKKHKKETIDIIRRKNKNKLLPYNFGEKQRKLKIFLKSDYLDKHPFFCLVEDIRNNPFGDGIQVHCKNHNCHNSKEQGGWFTPTSTQISERIRQLENEDGRGDGSFFYCSEQCKKQCPLYHLHGDPFKDTTKSYTQSEYQQFREYVLDRDNYKCQYCGEKAEHVHHEKPQKLEVFFALDPDLAWSVCKRCHYEKGHRDECSTGNLARKAC